MDQNKHLSKKSGMIYNLTHVKSNYKKIKSSPFASLLLAYKIRKAILIPLIAYIVYRGYFMVVDYKASGMMAFIGRFIMTAILIYLVYRIWKTIPQAKRQMEYYKKYPHTINYCPTNVKEDVNDILRKIEENKIKKDQKEVKKDVSKKEKGNYSRTNKSSS